MSEVQEVKHGELQFATKDVNEVLGLKQRHVAGRQILIDFIVITIDDCIGPDPENEEQSIWTDNRAAGLKPETIATYNALVEQGLATTIEEPEPSASGPVVQDDAEADTAEKTETEVASSEMDEQPKKCPSFSKDRDLNDPACTEQCMRTEECATVIEAKATKKVTEPKKIKEAKMPKEPSERYGYMNAVCDAIRSGNLSREALAVKTMELYTSHGGTGDLKQAERNLNTALRPLVLIGAVTEDNGLFTINPNL